MIDIDALPFIITLFIVKQLVVQQSIVKQTGVEQSLTVRGRRPGTF